MSKEEEEDNDRDLGEEKNKKWVKDKDKYERIAKRSLIKETNSKTRMRMGRKN